MHGKVAISAHAAGGVVAGSEPHPCNDSCRVEESWGDSSLVNKALIQKLYARMSRMIQCAQNGAKWKLTLAELP